MYTARRMLRKADHSQRPLLCRIVVVLYAPFGSGHYKAAEAIAVSARALNPTWRVEVVDVSQFLPRPIRGFFIKLWELLSRFCGAPYNYVYHRFASRFRHSILVSKLVDVAATSAAGKLSVQRAEAIVATHWFGAAVAARIKSQSKFHLSVVTTDYVIHSLHVYPEVDIYFSSKLSEMLLNDDDLRQVKQRIEYSGIPINARFAEDVAPPPPVNPGTFNILVSFGGLGLQWRRSLLMLHKVSNGVDGLRFTILAGANRRLAKYARILLPPGTTILGNQDDVVLAYRRAHAFVGKAGGLSVTEALASRLPVAIIAALPGQEVVNRRSLVSAGAATAVSTADDLVRWLRHVRGDKRLACRSFVVPRDSSTRIAGAILRCAGSSNRDKTISGADGSAAPLRKAA